MALLVRAALLCTAGALLGIAGNLLTPRPAPLGARMFAAAEEPGAACQDPRALSVARISVAEAKPLCLACTAAFVDARSAPEYAAGHVAGALHLAPREPVEPLLAKLQASPTVIVYDRDRDCAAADQVATLLRANGIHDVRVLTGAWPEWLAGGGPGESGTCPLCTAEPR
jgi:3-mercaptopyruvate sulfurtransferase SseA